MSPAFLDTATLIAGHGLFLAVAFTVLALAGRRWLQADLDAAAGALGTGAVALALGMGVAGTLLLLLGLAGLLRAAVVVTLAVALCAFEWRCLRRWTLHALSVARAHPTACLVAATLSLPAFLLTLYPPTGFDALTYHLPYARAFAESGRVGFLPELRFPIFPQLQELLFAAALLVHRASGARSLQLLATAGTACLLFAWGRSLESRRLGLWAAACWLGSPLVWWIGASAYIDAGLTFHATAALFAWERWHATRLRRWLWVAAATAGFAAADKYLGLFFVAALALMTMAFREAPPPSQRRFARWRNLAWWGLFATLAAVLWYGRILYHTGNPLFPYYGRWFGWSAWAPEISRYPGLEALSRSMAQANPAPLSQRLLDGLLFLLVTPWRAVFDRALFHYQAPIAPWFLAGSPLVLFLWRSSWARRWLLLILAYGLLWLTTVREIRFLMPIFPLASLLLARAATRLGNRLAEHAWWLRGQTAAVAIALMLLSPGFLYALYKLHELGPPPATKSARRAFLEAQVPAYAALRWLEAQPGDPPTVYGLYLESLRYYAPGPYLGEHTGPHRYTLMLREARKGGAALHRYLRSIGADYLLVPRARAARQLPHDTAFHRCFQPVFRGPRTDLLALAPNACRREP